jgi:hypothetical protein
MNEYENLEQYLEQYLNVHNKLEERAKLFYNMYGASNTPQVHSEYLNFEINKNEVYITYSETCCGYYETTSIDIPLDIFLSSSPLDNYKQYLNQIYEQNQKQKELSKKAEEERIKKQEYEQYLKLKSKFEN